MRLFVRLRRQIRALPPKSPQAQWISYNRILFGAVLKPLFTATSAKITAAERDYKSILRDIKNIKYDPSLALLTGSAARSQYRKLERAHMRRFTRQMKRHFGVRYRVRDNKSVQVQMNKFVRINVSLINTIPPRFHAGLVKDMQDLIAGDEAFNEKKLADVVRKNQRTTGYNLKRITRDQTSKALGNLDQVRQTGAGITEYRWSTSEDEAVRPSHKALNGRRFSWGEPPSVGHPGQDIMCRCVAIPIMPKKVIRSRRNRR